MKQEIKTELYKSPEVEVIEIKARQVICNSVYGGIDGINEESGVWD